VASTADATWRCAPEDITLHNHRCENLKSCSYFDYEGSRTPDNAPARVGIFLEVYNITQCHITAFTTGPMRSIPIAAKENNEALTYILLREQIGKELFFLVCTLPCIPHSNLMSKVKLLNRRLWPPGT
jgi:hypothetical protein